MTRREKIEERTKYLLKHVFDKLSEGNKDAFYCKKFYVVLDKHLRYHGIGIMKLPISFDDEFPRCKVYFIVTSEEGSFKLYESTNIRDFIEYMDYSESYECVYHNDETWKKHYDLVMGEEADFDSTVYFHKKLWEDVKQLWNSQYPSNMKDRNKADTGYYDIAMMKALFCVVHRFETVDHFMNGYCFLCNFADDHCESSSISKCEAYCPGCWREKIEDKDAFDPEYMETPCDGYLALDFDEIRDITMINPLEGEKDVEVI